MGDRFIALVQRQLDKIEPNIFYRGERIYPCWMRLRDGTIHEAVRVMDDPTFKDYTSFSHPRARASVFPDTKWISADDVAEIRESPKRLPARFSNQLARAGESSMGTFVFTVVFLWIWRKTYVTSGIDFLNYPTRMSPNRITKILPHAGRWSLAYVSEVDAPICMFSRGT